MPTTSTRLETLCRDHSGVSPDFSIHNETALSGPLADGGLDLDSLDRVELAMRVEDEFHIEMPDGDVDLPALGTFGGLCSYVQGKLDSRAHQ